MRLIFAGKQLQDNCSRIQYSEEINPVFRDAAALDLCVTHLLVTPCHKCTVTAAAVDSSDTIDNVKAKRLDGTTVFNYNIPGPSSFIRMAIRLASQPCAFPIAPGRGQRASPNPVLPLHLGTRCARQLVPHATLHDVRQSGPRAPNLAPRYSAWCVREIADRERVRKRGTVPDSVGWKKVDGIGKDRGSCLHLPLRVLPRPTAHM
ncbi:hypothetical protein B0H13DRAFT_2351293 [Mycena leptocephala]|nr:hypothetical protein B0H13DRAFT_2351293 [Mycena leptocephala]